MSSFFNIDHSLLLLLLLFLTFSLLLQTHARESQFFSKTERYTPPHKLSTSVPEEPAARTTLPPLSPQSHIGYGLYNPDQFPTTTSTTTTNYNYNNNVARYQPNPIPSTFTKTEFENKEFNANNNNNNNVPSSAFTYDTEFWDENYKNKEFNANRNTEYYENKEMNANNIPSGFSNGELNRGNYTYEKQYGRVMENGKYFYDVNAEEGGNYEPMKGNDHGEDYRRDGRNGGYSYGGNESGTYEYKNNNEVGEYQNNQEKHEENQEEYVP